MYSNSIMGAYSMRDSNPSPVTDLNRMPLPIGLMEHIIQLIKVVIVTFLNLLFFKPLLGFEPRYTDYKSVVLPLDDKGISGAPEIRTRNRPVMSR